MASKKRFRPTLTQFRALKAEFEEVKKLHSDLVAVALKRLHKIDTQEQTIKLQDRIRVEINQDRKQLNAKIEEQKGTIKDNQAKILWFRKKCEALEDKIEQLSGEKEVAENIAARSLSDLRQSSDERSKFESELKQMRRLLASYKAVNDRRAKDVKDMRELLTTSRRETATAHSNIRVLELALGNSTQKYNVLEEYCNRIAAEYEEAQDDYTKLANHFGQEQVKYDRAKAMVESIKADDRLRRFRPDWWMLPFSAGLVVATVIVATIALV